VTRIRVRCTAMHIKGSYVTVRLCWQM